MVIAIVLVLIVAAALLFQLLSPWWLTPLASNWQQMDDTLLITLVITGVAFVAINLFLAYTVVRYRHRKGSRAAYGAENKTLERWLIGLTAAGVIAMLAPGLFVYAKWIKVPKDALIVEVVGQQWTWHFRFPGKDGKLGVTDTRFMTAENPFGLNPSDPAGQDDILVDGPEVHLPVNKPILMLLRSKDVIHDFYVPEFRSRMNMVPGLVTRFWFIPTKTGRFEALCAQLCGIGHFNMRGAVVVENEAAFQAWLSAQPTFAQTMAEARQKAGGTLAEQGRKLAEAKGCLGCHSVDGSARVGPTWKDLYGKTETFTDGTTARVDEAYLKAFIRAPQARIPKGYPPIMPKFDLSDDELAALIAFIKANSSKAGTAAGQP